jgi:hypothetical protein
VAVDRKTAAPPTPVLFVRVAAKELTQASCSRKGEFVGRNDFEGV